MHAASKPGLITIGRIQADHSVHQAPKCGPGVLSNALMLARALCSPAAGF